MQDELIPCWPAGIAISKWNSPIDLVGRVFDPIADVTMIRSET